MSDNTDLQDFNEVTTATPPTVEITPPETPAPAPVATPTPPALDVEADRRVPLSEHLAERKRRQEIEADNALLRREMERQRSEWEKSRTPAKAPDIFEDPNGHFQSQIEPILAQQHAREDFNNRLIAETRFGEDKVKAAEAAFMQLVGSGQAHPLEIARIANAPNRYAEAVKWHKEHLVKTEVGDDPAAYRAKLRAELLADPEFRKEADAAWRQQAAGAAAPGAVIRPPVPSTPSLSRVGAAALPAQGEADVPDDELFRQTTARKRR